MTKQTRTLGVISVPRGVAGALALGLVLVAATPVRGQTYTVLHSFKGGDGAYADGGLVQDTAGNLYGTTVHGSNGTGVVFKLNKAGVETVLHAFVYYDGASPQGTLIRDAAGNLYGTAADGGIAYGVVFKVDAAGNDMTLYAFQGGMDGAFLNGGLVRDAAGNFYGTTYQGGAYNYGTVWKLGLTGAERVMHAFTGGSDGQYPYAGLVLDSAGNLYGTTNEGGTHGYGTVFKVSKTAEETVLYNFMGGEDGAYPSAGLILDSAGRLYGTAAGGGDTSCSGGCGTIFRIDGIGKETVLYSFTGGTDGKDPSASLLPDTAGNLYGTAAKGGDTSCSPPDGCGTAFKLDRTGTLAVLHTFTGTPDGAQPLAGLMMDSAGNLYGTTSSGGAYSYGTVFKITP